MTVSVTHTIDLVGHGRVFKLTTSDDGRLVAFVENPDANVSGSGEFNITLKDTVSGTSRAIRLDLDPALRSAQLTEPDLSGDGRYLAFLLTMPGGNASVVRLDLHSGALDYVSTAADGTQANGISGAPSVSRDGRYVAFSSGASNLVANDDNRMHDIFVKDMQTGALQRLSTGPDGAPLTNWSSDADLSANGKVVLFKHTPRGAMHEGMYAHNLDSGKVTLINGAPDGGVYPNTFAGSLSGDGRYAVFSTAGVPGSSPAVYRKDVQTGQLAVVEAAAVTLTGAGEPSISDDGRFVSYARIESLSGSPRTVQIFVKDIDTGVVTQVSRATVGGAERQVMSGDGSHLVFTSKDGGGAGASPMYVVAARLHGDRDPATATDQSQILLAHAGDQRVAGGAGTDLVSYRGNVDEYVVQVNAGMLTVTDTSAGRDGSDVLTGIERLLFADGALAFDADGTVGQAYRLYQAAFDRVPDQAGLSYWVNQLERASTLDQVATRFAASAEFTALYGANPGNAQVVAGFYNNILHRPGDAAGMAYWTDVLERRASTVGEVLADFSESAENRAALVGVVESGIAFQYYG